MTREEAGVVVKQTLEWVLSMYETYRTDGKLIAETKKAFDMAIAALRGHDPDTGLVPCGCGGRAGFHYSVIVDNDCYVECGICGVHSKVALCEEEARDAWNTAMGYTAPSRPGAGEMDPNGDEGAEL